MAWHVTDGPEKRALLLQWQGKQAKPTPIVAVRSVCAHTTCVFKLERESRPASMPVRWKENGTYCMRSQRGGHPAPHAHMFAQTAAACRTCEVLGPDEGREALHKVHRLLRDVHPRQHVQDSAEELPLPAHGSLIPPELPVLLGLIVLCLSSAGRGSCDLDRAGVFAGSQSAPGVHGNCKLEAKSQMQHARNAIGGQIWVRTC